MSFQDDPNDPEWKLTKLKSEPGTASVKDHNNSSSNKPKYSQKFCEKWLSIFSPWLARCEDDVNKPFCRACQCRLDCNRCHLQRHERTSKHARNLEILVNKGEGAARQNLSIRQERSKYYKQRKKQDTPTPQEDSVIGMDDYSDEPDQENEYTYEHDQQIDEQTSEERYTQEDSMGNIEVIMADEVEHMMATRSATKQHNTNTIGRTRSNKVMKHDDSSADNNDLPTSDHKEGMKLLLQIQKDKSELMDSFKELMGGHNMALPSPPKEKNHVDLFFESVSSSVKALSPKLIAEAKMRVSQLICELELRALTENDINQQHGGTSTVVLSNESTGGPYVINQTTMGHANETHQVHHYESLS